MKILRARRRGFALAVALVTLLILTVMGLALGAMGVENLNQIRESGEKANLLHMANGGLHEIMDRLYANNAYGQGVTDSSADGAGTFTSSGPAARYSWTFNTGGADPFSTNNLNGDTAVTGWKGMTVPPHMALVVISAREDGATSDRKTVRVGALVTNRFPYAIASDGEINVSDITSVIPGEGNVRSNMVGGSPNIEADSVDGMSFSRDGSGSIDISGNSGPEILDSPPIGLPNVPIADIVASQSTAGVAGAHPFGGPAAHQITGSGPFDITNDGGVLVINGTRLEPMPTAVYIPGDVVVTGGLDLPQGVHFFVRGNFRVNGGGGIDQSGTAPSPAAGNPFPPDSNFIFCTGAMRFNGAEGQNINLFAGTGIDQNGSSEYNGIMYVQNGPVTMSGTQDITGSIIARGGVTSDVDGQNADIKFDPSVFDRLDFLNLQITGPVRTASWWVEKG